MPVVCLKLQSPGVSWTMDLTSRGHKQCYFPLPCCRLVWIRSGSNVRLSSHMRGVVGLIPGRACGCVDTDGWWTVTTNEGFVFEVPLPVNTSGDGGGGGKLLERVDTFLKYCFFLGFPFITAAGDCSGTTGGIPGFNRPRLLPAFGRHTNPQSLFWFNTPLPTFLRRPAPPLWTHSMPAYYQCWKQY